MPNGYSIQLDQFGGTDAAGRAGVADQVDFHYRRLAIGVLVSALISTGAQVARGDRAEGDIRREIGDSIATDVNRSSRSIIERYLDVQPTITIRPGWPVRVSVNRDVRLTPYGRLPG
jgi:type IV secretion system protein VirB10